MGKIICIFRSIVSFFLNSTHDGSRQAMLCHVGGNKIKIKIVWPALVGGKKTMLGKLTFNHLVLENLENF